ncbi:MAG: hypothetical protein HY259_05250 [Chloroflexi bacterium]|nr:hypothetical protein [Chloroflexota bacterium]
MLKSFLQKRDRARRRNAYDQLSDAEFYDLMRRQPYTIQPEDVLGRLGLDGAQRLLDREWDSAKSETEVPGWRHLLKRLAVTLAQGGESAGFLRDFYGVGPDAPDGRAIRLAALRLATVPRYDREPTLILVADAGEPELPDGYPLPVKFVSRARYAQVEADYREQEQTPDWWQEDLYPAAQAIQYDDEGHTATLRFLWDGLGNGERYELRWLAPHLWGVVGYGELFVELA